MVTDLYADNYIGSSNNPCIIMVYMHVHGG